MMDEDGGDDEFLEKKRIERTYVLVCLSNETRPISNRGGHIAAIDVVKGRIKYPTLFDIVNLKADIRGYPIPDPRSAKL